MTIHTESRVIRASPDHLFDMVADVESYPDFLPLWVSAKVVARRGNAYQTEQEVGLGPLRQNFRTTTVLFRPRRIEVTSTDPLFRDFYIHWDFHPVGSGCRVTIAMSWQVQSGLMQKAIDQMLPKTAKAMVESFESRARLALFGGE